MLCPQFELGTAHRVHAPMKKVEIKNLEVTHKMLQPGKELLLCNENEGKQMKAKISHVKSIDDLHLRVHPVIANTEPTF